MVIGEEQKCHNTFAYYYAAAVIIVIITMGSSSVVSRVGIFGIFILGFAVVTASSSSSKIRVVGDGGYEGLVIKISDDGNVPEDKCPEIIENIRVSKNSGREK